MAQDPVGDQGTEGKDRESSMSTNQDSAFESPLEELFDENLRKYLADGVEVKTQVEVRTFVGTFRLDFVLEVEGKSPVGFEVDGVEFHKPLRDEWRDALILDASNVSAIYRIPGPLLYHHTEDVFFMLLAMEPKFFSERGRMNLDRLASRSVKGNSIANSGSGMSVTYVDQKSGAACFFKIVRHAIRTIGDERHRFLLDYARSHGSTDLDVIISDHLKTRNYAL